MRYTVVVSKVQVIGKIWMPPVLSAMEYTVSNSDIENMKDEKTGDISRSAVERWVMLHTGDFQSIEDWRAELEVGDETLIWDWEKEDSEMKYNDCMFPGVYTDV